MSGLISVPTRRLRSWQKAQLPVLWSSLDEDEEDDHTQLFTFFDGPVDHDHFVGAMRVSFRLIGVEKGRLPLDIYIEKFEVARLQHGKGYGKAMYQWLLSNYDIRKVGLCHIVDDEASYRFWRRMGLHKVDVRWEDMQITYR